jgi:hypothetical protein
MNRVSAFNQRVAEKVTALVSTMWAAYIFAAIALISLPAAIRTGEVLIIIAWVAQTFLQLVLLSIIMVGQKSAADIIAQEINETHTAAVAEFELAKESRAIADQQLREIKQMAQEIHRILKDVEKK